MMGLRDVVRFNRRDAGVNKKESRGEGGTILEPRLHIYRCHHVGEKNRAPLLFDIVHILLS